MSIKSSNSRLQHVRSIFTYTVDFFFFFFNVCEVVTILSYILDIKKLRFGVCLMTFKVRMIK